MKDYVPPALWTPGPQEPGGTDQVPDIDVENGDDS
jgi:hypothetical protein